MKLRLFISSCIIIVCSALWGSPENPHHLDAYKKLKIDQRGPLKEIVSQAGNNSAEAVYTYNNKNQIESVVYFRNGQKEGESKFTYGKSGIESEVTMDTNGNEVEQVVYKYNALGVLLGYSVKAGKDEIKWEYGLNNKTVTSGKRIVNGEITETFKLTRNKDLETLKIFNSQGEEAGVIQVSFSNGKLKERVRKDETGLRKVTYTYSADGRLSNVKFFTIENGKEIEQKSHQMVWGS